MKNLIAETKESGLVSVMPTYTTEGLADITREIYKSGTNIKDFIFLVSADYLLQIENIQAAENYAGCYEKNNLFDVSQNSAENLVRELLCFSFWRYGFRFHVFIYPHFKGNEKGFIMNDDFKCLIIE
tara:strand:+ start:321 stop:701 length:381 start_codon:yes stop_codon:yes gene_type:complete